MKRKSDLYGRDGKRTEGVQVNGIKFAKNINRKAYAAPSKSRNKFYDKYIWQKTRESYRNANPLCEVCKAKGILAPMTLVHHIQPLEEGGEQLDQDNLMSLCGERCHRKLHAMIDKDKLNGNIKWTRESVLSRV